MILTATVALAHVYLNTLGVYAENLVSAFHFATFAILSCLLPQPASLGSRGRSWTQQIWRWLVPFLAAAAGLYLIFFEDALYARGQELNTADAVFAVCAILGAMELARRTSGWMIPALVVVAISYVVFWGRYLPGVFSFPGLSLESVLYRLYFSPEGMFGLIAKISWSYVFMFMLFGAFLLRSGGGDFMIALARAAAGRIRGAPGYVAVLGSGLMGSISGSAIANTAATGTITIPLMKRAGFDARFAAAVEAASSTGGQLMPPIMGAGAFIMASYTQVGYLEILSVALLPAILYFLTVMLFVGVEVRRSFSERPDAEETPAQNLSEVLRSGWHHAVPLGVLVALLIWGFSPTYSAAVAILAIVGVSWRRGRGMHLADILGALDHGVRSMIPTALLLVTIGLVVNVLTTTGLGNTLSLRIVEWSGGSVALMILLLALVSLVLGMGLPVTASYVVLATVAAASLQGLLLEGRLVEALASGELGEAARQVLLLYGASDPTLLSPGEIRALLADLPVEMRGMLIEEAVPATAVTAALLSAHLIIFYLSQDSNVTPPVCLAAFTAAAIAGSRPMATGVVAWKLAKGLYVIPFLIAYQPFVGSGPEAALRVFVIGLVATALLVGTLEGFGSGIFARALRLGCLGGALFLLAPGPSPELRFIAALCGAALAVAVFMARRSRRSDSPIQTRPKKSARRP